jgi:hypothetical protein
MSRYQRRDAGGPEDPRDPDQIRDLGLDDHLVPAGIPHITNKAVVQQEAPDAPPRPLYRGHMAHGVATPAALDRPQAGQPLSQTHWNQATAGLATFTPPSREDEGTYAPIAVTIVEPASGDRPMHAASFLHYVIPAAGSMPVRVCGRDLHRRKVHFINETSPPAATYLTPGVYSQATGSTAAPGGGAVVGSALYLASGVYTVGWSVGFSVGVPAVGDDNNFQLMSPAATQLAVSVNVHAAPVIVYPQAAVTLTVPTGGALVEVKAVGAATAGVTYTEVITTQLKAPYSSTPMITQGVVTGPAGGGVIGTATTQNTTVLGAGTYLVNWTPVLTGTMTAAETCNFGLYLGSTLLAISSNPNVVGAYPQVPVTVTVPAAGGVLSMKAIAAAGGAAVYSGNMQIILQPVTPPVPGIRLAHFPGDLTQDVATGYTLSGAMVLPGVRVPLETQREVWAVAEGAVPATLSVIQEYDVPIPK